MRFPLALALPLLAAAQDFSEFQKRVTQFTLDNGFTFIVYERHQAPVASFHTYVNAGSAFDPPSRPGVARMLERMAFKGSAVVGSSDWQAEKKALEAIEEAYERLDAERARTPADAASILRLETQVKLAIQRANAYAVPHAYRAALEVNGVENLSARAGADAIEYSYSLPSNRVELWFLLEGERLRRPVFREYYKERDALIEERGASTPSNALLQAVIAAALAGHPYATAGERAPVKDLRARDADRFVRTHFTPSNITIAIAGDVNPAQVKQLAAKHFGAIPGAGPPPKPSVSQRTPAEAEVAIAGDPMLCVAYRRPDQHDKDDAVIDIIAAMLGGGPNGLLHDGLIEGRRVAVSATVRSSTPGTRFEHLFLFLIVPSGASTLEENQRALLEILEGLQSAPPPEQRLKRAKAMLRAELVGRMSANPSLASLLAAAHANYSDWRRLISTLDDLERVSAADVQRVAGQRFTAERRTIGYSGARR